MVTYVANVFIEMNPYSDSIHRGECFVCTGVIKVSSGNFIVNLENKDRKIQLPIDVVNFSFDEVVKFEPEQLGNNTEEKQ